MTLTRNRARLEPYVHRLSAFSGLLDRANRAGSDPSRQALAVDQVADATGLRRIPPTEACDSFELLVVCPQRILALSFMRGATRWNR
jgi:hypothetical protein